jgi:hypothetical protein
MTTPYEQSRFTLAECARRCVSVDAAAATILTRSWHQPRTCSNFVQSKDSGDEIKKCYIRDCGVDAEQMETRGWGYPRYIGQSVLLTTV